MAELWATSHLLSGQTFAAHISPDATDAEPSLPQEPRRLWCLVETQVPRSAVLPLISDLKVFPRRPLESNKPGGLDCLGTILNPSCLLSLRWPCQPFHRLAIRSFMYSFIQQMFVEHLLRASPHEQWPVRVDKQTQSLNS